MNKIVKGLLVSLILVGGGFSFALSTAPVAGKICKTCSDGFRPEQ